MLTKAVDVAEAAEAITSCGRCANASATRSIGSAAPATRKSSKRCCNSFTRAALPQSQRGLVHSAPTGIWCSR